MVETALDSSSRDIFGMSDAFSETTWRTLGEELALYCLIEVSKSPTGEVLAGESGLSVPTIGTSWTSS